MLHLNLRRFVCFSFFLLQIPQTGWCEYHYLAPDHFEGDTLYQSFSSQVAHNRPILFLELTRRSQSNRGVLPYETLRREVFQEFIANGMAAGALEAGRAIDGIARMSGDPEFSEGRIREAIAVHGADWVEALPALDLSVLPREFVDSHGRHRISSRAAEQLGSYTDLLSMENTALTQTHTDLHAELAALSAAQRTRSCGAGYYLNQGCQVIDAADQAQRRAADAPHYQLNWPAITLADPYLKLHNNDLETEIRAADITDPALEATIADLVDHAMGTHPRTVANAGDLAVARAAQGITDARSFTDHLRYLVGIGRRRALSYPDNPSTVRRRFVRLVKAAQATEDPLRIANFAIAATNPSIENRCIDGINSAFMDQEIDLLGEAAAIRPAEHMGDLISRILSEEKRSYLSQTLAVLNRAVDSQEVRTDMGVKVRNDLLPALGLDGAVNPTRYSFHFHHAFFGLESMVQRFVRGGVGAVENAGLRAEYAFAPITVRRLVERLVESRKLTLNHPSPSGATFRRIFTESGLRMTDAVFTQEMRDPIVNEHFTQFTQFLDQRHQISNRLAALVLTTDRPGDEETRLSADLLRVQTSIDAHPFFAVPPHRISVEGRQVGVDYRSFLIKPEFALYLLTKYQYVLTR